MVLAGWFLAGPVGLSSRGLEKSATPGDERATARVSAVPIATQPIRVATADLPLPLPAAFAASAPATDLAAALPAAEVVPPASAVAAAEPVQAAQVAPVAEATRAAEIAALPQEPESSGAAAPARVFQVASADSRTIELTSESPIITATVTPIALAKTTPSEPGFSPAALAAAEAAIDAAAKPDPDQAREAEVAPMRLAALNPSDLLPGDVKDTPPAVPVVDLCAGDDDCIDQYLYALYLRAPKVDCIKVPVKTKVAVKKKGKVRMVTKTVTHLVDEDFAWKDPKAADKVGMPLKDYVIGGMDKSFKRKLYLTMRTLDVAGFVPGITSGFRDDYRQALARGKKAASDSSYHGGSRRGGYGHGLAADIVSVKGENRMARYRSTDELWKWVDVHEKETGIGRPYLDRDPPHVGPTDGKEYADKRGIRLASNPKPSGWPYASVIQLRMAKAGKAKAVAVAKIARHARAAKLAQAAKPAPAAVAARPAAVVKPAAAVKPAAKPALATAVARLLRPAKAAVVAKPVRPAKAAVAIRPAKPAKAEAPRAAKPIKTSQQERATVQR